MTDTILVLNAGSSSVKFSVFLLADGRLEQDVHGQLEGLVTSPRFIAKDRAGNTIGERSWGDGVELGHDGALDYLTQFLRDELDGLNPVAVGHRVVHGGLEFTQPALLDRNVVTALERFVPLAPLHQPHNLTPIRLIFDRYPQLPQVACFDTSFHRTNPSIAQRFAIPEALYAEGVLRYGFHGLSYEYIASVLPEYDERAAAGRTVALHLGNGASMCALVAGRSIASTMGFTAVEGLPMGTRCGSIDPGVLLYLIDVHGMDARALENLIYNESGLLGVSGISSDMRTLLASDDPRARLAIDLYVYRIGRELGSLAAALGGLDAIVFTAGIGENAAEIRRRVVEDAGWLGARLNLRANRGSGPRISTKRSRVSVWVVPTNEELVIARHTARLVGRTT